MSTITMKLAKPTADDIERVMSLAGIVQGMDLDRAWFVGLPDCPEVLRKGIEVPEGAGEGIEFDEENPEHVRYLLALLRAVDAHGGGVRAVARGE